MPITAAPIKNLTLVRVTLAPTVVTNASASDDPITLDCTDKTLPGISDAETWTINTDNPEQEIAETIAGKFGGISALEFNVTYDPLLMATLVAHANTKFTVQFVIDDPALDAIIGINVPGCRLVSPGSSSSASNSSAGAMTVKLQPSGGGLIADVLQVVQTART